MKTHWLFPRIVGAANGCAFLTATAVEGTIVSFARGELREAVMLGASIPRIAVIGATAGAVGWMPTWSPENLWAAARAAVKGNR